MQTSAAAVAARILMFPAACLAGFGRWHEPYLFFAHSVAIVPGLLGNYLRMAYYKFTLDGGRKRQSRWIQIVFRALQRLRLVTGSGLAPTAYWDR